MGAKGGAERQFALKFPKKQRYQARAALLDRQVPGVVPQGHVRFAIFGVGLKAVGAGLQGIQAEIGPQPVAVVIGLIRPQFAPENVFLIAPQFLGSDIDCLEFLLGLEFRLLHHHLDVLQLQAVALLQGHPAAEAGQQIQNFLPGSDGRIPHHHMAPGVAGEVLNFYFRKRYFSALYLWHRFGLQGVEKGPHHVEGIFFTGIPEPNRLMFLCKVLRLHQVVDYAVGLADARWCYLNSW